jgi:hypothetical protein
VKILGINAKIQTPVQADKTWTTTGLGTSKRRRKVRAGTTAWTHGRIVDSIAEKIPVLRLNEESLNPDLQNSQLITNRVRV